jgi:hypothetical protein
MRRLIPFPSCLRKLCESPVYGHVALNADVSVGGTTETNIFSSNTDVVTNNGSWWNTTDDGIVPTYDCLIMLTWVLWSDNIPNFMMYPNINGTNVTDGTARGNDANPGVAAYDWGSWMTDVARGQTIKMNVYNADGGALNVMGDAAQDETQLKWAVIRKL